MLLLSLPRVRARRSLERERERRERAERYSPPLPRVDPENFSSAQDRLEAEEGRGGGRKESRCCSALQRRGENEYVRTGPPSFSLPSPLSSHERLPSLEEEEELETAALDGTEGGRRGVSPPSFHSPPQKNGGLFFFLLILFFLEGALGGPLSRPSNAAQEVERRKREIAAPKWPGMKKKRSRVLLKLVYAFQCLPKNRMKESLLFLFLCFRSRFR